jgi:uncharacterized protein YdcH (DUF465 family)
MVSITILIRKQRTSTLERACFLDLDEDPPASRGLEWTPLHHHDKDRPMFPEYRELISQLKTTDHHFQHLFDRHNELDQQIKNMEAHIVGATHEEIEAAKKEKLILKDQLYAILRKASATA